MTHNACVMQKKDTTASVWSDRKWGTAFPCYLPKFLQLLSYVGLRFKQLI